jgi:hypothetical protein
VIKLASDGKTQFLCGLCLGAVHRDEAVDFRGGMKPQSRPQVSEIERPRRNDSGQDMRLADVERQITQHEKAGVLYQAVETRLVLVGIQRPVSCQPDQIPSGLERTV